MRVRLAAVAAVAVFAAAAVYGAGTSRSQADAFAKKVALVALHAEAAPGTARRTTFSEGELNSWFEFGAQPLLPEGVTRPTATLIGGNRLIAGVTVDLDAVAKRRASGGSLDPWSYLTGRVPVSVTGRLHTSNGGGSFEIQSADISGVPVPRALLQELLSYYTRSDERPQGVRLDDRFDLPAGIQRVEIAQGQAVVVQ